MAAVTERIPFSPLPRSTLASRLARQFSDAGRAIAQNPLSFLRFLFIPERGDDLLVFRLAKGIVSAASVLIRHPIRTIRGARGADWAVVIAMTPSTLSWIQFIDRPFVANAVDSTADLVYKPGHRFRPVFALSALAHSGLIVYLVYLIFFSPFTGIRVVNKKYRQLKTDEILATLYYPPQVLQMYKLEQLKKLEEIQAAERRRKEELEREKARREKEQKEKEEKERLAKEKEARAKAELARKEAETATPGKFGEINEAPIKDIVGKLYAMYQKGELGIAGPDFSVMAVFKIESDGSISNIKIVRSSGSKIVDENAVQILWNIGESHAIGPLASLRSTSIRLDLKGDITRLTITGFAPSPDEARGQADKLSILLKFIRFAQKNKSPDVAELLSLMTIKSEGNRVDADLTVSRERASQMMRSKFGNNNP
jgi:hypothetical protein